MKLNVIHAINLTQTLLLNQEQGSDSITTHNSNTTQAQALAHLRSKNTTNEELFSDGESYGFIEEAFIDSKPQECVLEAKLVYSNDDYKDQQTKSHHSDILTIERNDDNDLADNCYPSYSIFTDWCALSQEDEISEELLVFSDVSSTTLTFALAHHFLDEKYYNQYDNFEDRVPAGLSVRNKAKNELVSPAQGWEHDVRRETEFHEEKKRTNPAYFYSPQGFEGKFSVSVTCDRSCDCTAGEITLL